jgi:hypothetical protein
MVLFAGIAGIGAAIGLHRRMPMVRIVYGATNPHVPGEMFRAFLLLVGTDPGARFGDVNADIIMHPEIMRRRPLRQMEGFAPINDYQCMCAGIDCHF